MWSGCIGIFRSVLKWSRFMRRAPLSSERPIEVVCLVLVDQENRFLATQRSGAGPLAMKWEFPGGKVEDGEDHESALRRELQEELCVEVGDLTALASVSHAYDFGNIRLWPFLSRCKQRPQLKLVEHNDYIWCPLTEVDSLDWAPADVPILADLVDLL